MRNLKFLGVAFLAVIIGFGLVSCADTGSLDPDKTYKFQGFSYTGTNKTGLTITAFEPPKGAFVDQEAAAGDYIAEIPSKIDGKNVIAIDRRAFIGKELDDNDEPAADKTNRLVRVSIPSSVESIGFEAFAYQDLTIVDLPNAVEIIGDGAFRDNKLESINIPTGLTSIGNDVFANNELTSIVIPDNIETIGAGAFAGAFKDGAPTISIEIGENVTVSIGSNPSFGELEFEDFYVNDPTDGESKGGIYTTDDKGATWSWAESGAGGGTGTETPISITALTLTGPVNAAVPQKTIPSPGTGIATATVVWSSDNASWDPDNDNFASGEIYTAIITLTADTDYIFDSTTAVNSITVSGGGESIDTQSHPAGSGTTLVITVVYDQTT